MTDPVRVVAMSDPSVVQPSLVNPTPAEPTAAAVEANTTTPATTTPADDPASERRSVWKIILTIGALGLMSGLFLFFPIDWEKVGAWGYLGVFVVTFIATASFVLPIPYLLIVARAGIYLDPLLLTLVAGLAGALGELTGYVVGVSGRDLIARGKWYEKANHLMVTYGFWCVAFFAFVGFAAGVLRYPLWRFVLACFLGKSLKFWFAAESHLVVSWTCAVFPVACDAIRTMSLIKLVD
jgi:membrane protein YqaA with SNARE-associated domain